MGRTKPVSSVYSGRAGAILAANLQTETEINATKRRANRTGAIATVVGSTGAIARGSDTEIRFKAGRKGPIAGTSNRRGRATATGIAAYHRRPETATPEV